MDEAALEEDFDPEKWDQHMAQAFGEEYYEQVRCYVVLVVGVLMGAYIGVGRGVVCARAPEV